MIDNNLKNMSCKSKEYYRNITSIEVIPCQETDYSKYLLHRKGDRIIKKRLFRKPSITIVQEDTYKIDGEKRNAQSMAAYWGSIYDPEKNMFFWRGKVNIYFGREHEAHYFNTNEELKIFVSDLKDKCKLCGNELL